jgi:hypothetical protein
LPFKLQDIEKKDFFTFSFVRMVSRFADEPKSFFAGNGDYNQPVG